jgi:DNA polymerase-4
MDYQIEFSFNPKPSTIMHIDLNSCFASIEQQANPLLRGKPIAVAAYTSPGGCIIAPSVEAKEYGIKTGMRVKEGRLLYPKLVVLTPDPWKYRTVHLRFRNLLKTYTNDVTPKSIDEFTLNLEGCPAFRKGMTVVAEEIKKRVKEEVGEWLRVSIGIAPNRFLAKTAAGLRKPDGLDEINQANFLEVYRKLKLADLCGIKSNNISRLNSFGIHTVLDFYQAGVRTNVGAFRSIVGYYWYLRLRGWEVDDVEFSRKSFGNSVALGKGLTTSEELSPILQKLIEKTSFRMRKAGYMARGVHVSILYSDYSFWHQGMTLSQPLFDSRDIYKQMYKIFLRSPYSKSVRELAVSCFNLVAVGSVQLELFEDADKKLSLVRALDKINERWGDFTITPALMLEAGETVKDRVAFGGVRELEEFTLTDFRSKDN